MYHYWTIPVNDQVITKEASCIYLEFGSNYLFLKGANEASLCLNFLLAGVTRGPREPAAPGQLPLTHGGSRGREQSWEW